MSKEKPKGVEVEFTQNKDTMNYGKVSAGDKLVVSDEDAKAFCKNGVAKKVKGGK